MQATARRDPAEPVLMGWSGGKDSALAVQALQADASKQLRVLLTTVTETYDRISMHGVRRGLLARQAESLGIPLHEVFIPSKCDNATYEARMESALSGFREEGIRRCAFGDLFLEDVRAYRDQQLARAEMEALYPIWGLDTGELAERFIRDGFKTILVCVDPRKIDPSFCGREFDESLLADLPESVDPCGENGEFHTFVHAGPIFRELIPVSKGEIVERDGFWFCDLMPV